MRTDIFNILKRVADYEIPAVMNTNGYLIDEKTAQKLSRYELDLVTISLDGSVPRTHENFRGAKGAFKKAVDAIRKDYTDQSISNLAYIAGFPFYSHNFKTIIMIQMYMHRRNDL